MAAKKVQKSMADVTKDYEAFISSKKVIDTNGHLFDKALKKAAKSLKQRGLK